MPEWLIAFLRVWRGRGETGSISMSVCLFVCLSVCVFGGVGRRSLLRPTHGSPTPSSVVWGGKGRAGFNCN